jgi:hypothetical protein
VLANQVRWRASVSRRGQPADPALLDPALLDPALLDPSRLALLGVTGPALIQAAGLTLLDSSGLAMLKVGRLTTRPALLHSAVLAPLGASRLALLHSAGPSLSLLGRSCRRRHLRLRGHLNFLRIRDSGGLLFGLLWRHSSGGLANRSSRAPPRSTRLRHTALPLLAGLAQLAGLPLLNDGSLLVGLPQLAEQFRLAQSGWMLRVLALHRATLPRPASDGPTRDRARGGRHRRTRCGPGLDRPWRDRILLSHPW